MTIEQPKDKELVLDILDEMRSNVKHAGNKSLRDKTSMKLPIGASFFKEKYFSNTIFLSSDPNEHCDRL